MDDCPFDRPHVTVGLCFPLAHIARRASLFGEVRDLAAKRGGREAGTSEPSPGFAGRPGYDTFGISVAFEAGDANIEGFIQMCRACVGGSGLEVEYAPEDVTEPGPEPSAPRR